MNHYQLVVHLPARPEAATLGVQDIPNRHPAKLHPGVGYRQMLSRFFRVSCARREGWNLQRGLLPRIHPGYITYPFSHCLAVPEWPRLLVCEVPCSKTPEKSAVYIAGKNRALSEMRCREYGH